MNHSRREPSPHWPPPEHWRGPAGESLPAWPIQITLRNDNVLEIQQQGETFPWSFITESKAPSLTWQDLVLIRLAYRYSLVRSLCLHSQLYSYIWGVVARQCGVRAVPGRRGTGSGEEYGGWHTRPLWCTVRHCTPWRPSAGAVLPRHRSLYHRIY